MGSPNTAKQRIEVIQRVLTDVAQGLEGNRFTWGSGQREHWVPLLERVGMTLRTKTQITKMGYRLKRGAQPVGRAYYDAPLQRYAELYLIEYQCVAVQNPAADSQTESPPDINKTNT